MIGLPHYLHTEITLAACAARKHIFLEKPMAMTVADCDAIIAAAEEAGVKLLVAHTEHFVPAGLAAKRQLFEDGAIRERWSLPPIPGTARSICQTARPGS